MLFLVILPWSGGMVFNEGDQVELQAVLLYLCGNYN
jgi:hypothetical protein